MIQRLFVLFVLLAALGGTAARADNKGLLHEMEKPKISDAIKSWLPTIKGKLSLFFDDVASVQSLSDDDLTARILDDMNKEENAIIAALRTRYESNYQALNNLDKTVYDIFYAMQTGQKTNLTDEEQNKVVGGCQEFASQALEAVQKAAPTSQIAAGHNVSAWRWHSATWLQRRHQALLGMVRHHVVLITNDVVGNEWVWDGWKGIGGWAVGGSKSFDFTQAIRNAYEFFSSYTVLVGVQGHLESRIYPLQQTPYTTWHTRAGHQGQ